MMRKTAQTRSDGKGRLSCPDCKQPLKVVTDEGSRIDACQQCRGVWVRHEDEKKVLRITPQVFTVDELRRLRQHYKPLGTDDPVRLRACPSCKALMYRRNWGGHSGVIVDRCRAHGAWYDDRELEKIREFIELGGIELQKLRIAERGLTELETKMEKRTAELDLRIIRSYRRARMWSLFGF
jgi:Zn-finger nucleic acid-binding protein